MRILIALLVICVGSAAFWANMDRPMQAPDWSGEVRGLAYSPSHTYTVAQDKAGVSEERIRSDLATLSKYTNRIRTYNVDKGLDRIPYIAKDFGMKVSLGIWLSDDLPKNEMLLAKGIKAVNDNPSVVDRVFVGNEAVGVRAELSADQVADYVARVRKGVTNRRIEVGYADVAGAWLTNPEMGKESRLVKESQFIAAHFLPYWDGIRSEDSIAYVSGLYKQMQAKFPNKKIVIGETGWPSEGRVKKGAVPSASVEAYFLRHFLKLANEQNYDYYLMESFDTPFKAENEGAVGAFWGMLDAEGNPKFSWTGALSSFPQWKTFAVAAAAATFVLGAIVLALLPTVTLQGYFLVASIVGLVVSGALFIVDASSLRYVDLSALGGALFIVPTGLFTALLLLTESSEWALSLWRKRRIALPTKPLTHEPRVSIHLPTHNEPPQMVIQTLNALERLAYKNFEVIVLDNNTKDEADWKPVEAHCRTLGERFRFYHFDNMKGFKAGALNKALELTDPAAEFVAVIDSDYQVQPHWLHTVMPGFADPRVAIVQAPQDYRDAHESLFKSFCYEEYTGFFRIGMVERNQHNAIIQHGTMCVMRKAAMVEVGGWAEWCITEDTELGLRLFEAGYIAHYTSESMGRGLMPDTYAAFKSQRYRWVYGAMQIMKRHAAQIFGGKSKLTLAQRYHFVAGWMPWFADGFALIFGVLSLVWTALMAIAPKHFDVPLTALSAVALTLFTIKTIKTVWLHRAKVGTGFAGSIASALTGLALAYTVGKGVLLGLFTSSSPFLRTPKCENSAPWTHALRIAAMETAMLVGTVLAIIATVTVTRVDDPAEVVWAFALGVMAVPHAAAVLVAVGSTVKLGRRTAPVLEPDLTLAPVPVYPAAKPDLAA
jgi:cellulose synthase/poly-beta-1,6-N-acetylglucosamine synthase-like glycosyltransferase/exo-beta-1,3-glucanase (GH17 family)